MKEGTVPRYREAERQLARDATRQRLLDAAVDEFARAGYEAANINRISTHAGFAKGTVYNYFPSKRDLVLAALDRIAKTHFAYLSARVLATERPAQRLQVFFDAGFAFVVEHLAQARLMFNTVHGPDGGLKAHIYRAYQPMFAMVSDQILAVGVADGTFRSMEQSSMTHLVMTIYLGTASLVSDDGKPFLRPRQVGGFVLRALQSAAE